MATYTPNYQLHQWVAEDNFLRTDFNEDFRKIDEGIAQAEARIRQVQAEKCRIVTGVYSGDGAASREITLGFRPLAVLVENSFGKRPAVDYHMTGGLAVQGGALTHFPNTAPAITENGFRVLNGTECGTNTEGNSYRYLAIRAGT